MSSTLLISLLFLKVLSTFNSLNVAFLALVISKEQVSDFCAMEGHLFFASRCLDENQKGTN